jgi:hypothetical protein
MFRLEVRAFHGNSLFQLEHFFSGLKIENQPAPTAATHDAIKRLKNLNDMFFLVPSIKAILTELKARLTAVALFLIDRGIPGDFFLGNLFHGRLLFPSS